MYVSMRVPMHYHIPIIMALLKIVNSVILVCHCSKECVDIGMQVLLSALRKSMLE